MEMSAQEGEAEAAETSHGLLQSQSSFSSSSSTSHSQSQSSRQGGARVTRVFTNSNWSSKSNNHRHQKNENENQKGQVEEQQQEQPQTERAAQDNSETVTAALAALKAKKKKPKKLKKKIASEVEVNLSDNQGQSSRVDVDNSAEIGTSVPVAVAGTSASNNNNSNNNNNQEKAKNKQKKLPPPATHNPNSNNNNNNNRNSRGRDDPLPDDPKLTRTVRVNTQASKDVSDGSQQQLGEGEEAEQENSGPGGSSKKPKRKKKPKPNRVNSEEESSANSSRSYHQNQKSKASTKNREVTMHRQPFPGLYYKNKAEPGGGGGGVDNLSLIAREGGGGVGVVIPPPPPQEVQQSGFNFRGGFSSGLPSSKFAQQQKQQQRSDSEAFASSTRQQPLQQQQVRVVIQQDQEQQQQQQSSRPKPKSSNGPPPPPPSNLNSRQAPQSSKKGNQNQNSASAGPPLRPWQAAAARHILKRTEDAEALAQKPVSAAAPSSSSTQPQSNKNNNYKQKQFSNPKVLREPHMKPPPPNHIRPPLGPYGGQGPPMQAQHYQQQQKIPYPQQPQFFANGPGAPAGVYQHPPPVPHQPHPAVHGHAYVPAMPIHPIASIPLPSQIFKNQLPPEINPSFLVVPVPGYFQRGGPSPYNVKLPKLPNFIRMFQNLSGDATNLSREKIKSLTMEFNKLPLTKQLDEFFACQTLPPVEVQMQWQLLLDILLLLRANYPECEVYAFGSAVTGLADYSSDIDIYVDLLGESNPVRISPRESVRLVRRIFHKNRCPHSGNSFAKKLISINQDRVRVPILKLSHGPSGIDCDLSFGNRLSVQNSKMLAFYLNLDTRIKRFMVLVRYWAKFHKVTGSSKIKNYALTLLVLVYLCKMKLVPTVSFLQKLKAEERSRNQQTTNPDEIEGWDASFCDNLAAIKSRFKMAPFPGTSDTLTLILMAKDFFFMYGNMDLSTVVVCPLLGEFLPREQFRDLSRLPESLSRYKHWAEQQISGKGVLDVNTYFCVQDPFDLAFNIGCATPSRTVHQFQVACIRTAEDLQNAGDLNSLLQVFKPLPGNLGGSRPRFKVPKASAWRAIRGDLGLIKQTAKKQKGSEDESLANLPPHLRQFIEEETTKQEKVEQDRIDEKMLMMTDFKQSTQFEALFTGELERYNLKVDDVKIVQGMTMVWKDFAHDFLKEFFTQGFKLEVVNIKTKFQKTATKKTGKAGKDVGEKTWKLKMVAHSKSSSEFIPPEKFPDEVKLFERRIKSFPPKTFEFGIYYQALTLRVTYPFWKNRKPVTRQVINEMKQEYGEKCCYNPIEIERRVSETLLENFRKEKKEEKSEDFTPFQFKVWIRLNFSSIGHRPNLVILFEEDLDEGRPKNQHYIQATDNLSKILEQAFPIYQMSQLSKWLECSEVDACCDVSNSENEVEATTSGSQRGSKAQRKRKKTKQEEDLLIPSSSSSSCSSLPEASAAIKPNEGRKFGDTCGSPLPIPIPNFLLSKPKDVSDDDEGEEEEEEEEDLGDFV